MTSNRFQYSDAVSLQSGQQKDAIRVLMEWLLRLYVRVHDRTWCREQLRCWRPQSCSTVSRTEAQIHRLHSLYGPTPPAHVWPGSVERVWGPTPPSLKPIPSGHGKETSKGGESRTWLAENIRNHVLLRGLTSTGVHGGVARRSANF